MASVKFSIRKRKGKTAAIVLRFTIDRAHRFLLVTGEFIDPKYWDLKNQRVRGSHDEHLLLNQALDRIRVDVIQLYRDNRSKSIDELQDMARSLIKFGTTEVVEKKKPVSGPGPIHRALRGPFRRSGIDRRPEFYSVTINHESCLKYE